jgi:hypothetical protein
MLLGSAAIAAAPAVAVSGAWQEPASEADEIASVQSHAKKAGIGPLSSGGTTRFLGLGDAGDRFRKSALSICESLATAFLPHFHEKGFHLTLPKRRMTVITLKDEASYAAYLGEEPGTRVGGHYDLETNRLVMFDFRPSRDAMQVEADPELVNLLALVHETTHLLCFNTGLLSRQTDVPDCVSEGLATYVEVWRKKPPTKIGAVNGPWLRFLLAAPQLMPMADLLATDESFWNDKTQDLSYAQSWLFVHYMLKYDTPRRSFQSYLAGILAQSTAAQRLEYAEKHLGSLKTLDRDLSRYLKRLAR